MGSICSASLTSITGLRFRSHTPLQARILASIAGARPLISLERCTSLNLSLRLHLLRYDSRGLCKVRSFSALSSVRGYQGRL